MSSSDRINAARVRTPRPMLLQCAALLLWQSCAWAAPTASPFAQPEHHCTIDAGGTVTCAGRNASGQLGDGTHADRETPVTVAGGERYVALAIGGAHTCALSATGRAWCWGDNTAGQLGDGTNTSRSVPTPVAGAKATVRSLPAIVTPAQSRAPGGCSAGAGTWRASWAMARTWIATPRRRSRTRSTTPRSQPGPGTVARSPLRVQHAAGDPTCRASWATTAAPIPALR